MCLEVVRLLEVLAEDSVIVDLAVDGEGDCLVIVDDWLRAGICSRELMCEDACMTGYAHTNADDAQTLMDEDCIWSVGLLKSRCSSGTYSCCATPHFHLNI